MRETFELSCVPANEPCQQVGMPTYDDAIARRECIALKNQLIRMCGSPPEGSTIRIKRHSHDYGSYMELVYQFDDNDASAVDYMMMLDERFPDRWDIFAIAELADIMYTYQH